MNLLKNVNGKVKRPAIRLAGGRRSRALIPAIVGLAVAAVLLCLGLTQFLLKGYLAEDGFAVPREELTDLLRSGDDSGQVELLEVSVGDAIYTSAVGSRGYFIGENKLAINSGYPIYARGGQVLYFLDNSLKMVTEDWTTLFSYDGLYLSDGVTYNADGSQADLERILLVQVDGGYQLGQQAELSNTWGIDQIPANAVCVFSEQRILHYDYQDGLLVGGSIQITEDSVITINGTSYPYLDFLNRLGLWEEETPQEPEPPADPPEEPPEEDDGEDEKDKAHATAKPSAPAPAQQPEPMERPDRPAIEPDADRKPKPPAPVTQTPKPPQENPDAAPAAPAAPADPVPANPQFVEPTVKFSQLDPWVYTLSVNAEVLDPAQVLLKGGVQLTVSIVEEKDGVEQETEYLRQTVSASNAARMVTIGQLPPNTKFHVSARYEYTDADDIPRVKTLDLGYATTLAREGNLDPIRVSLSWDGVETFPKSLQMKNVVFDNVRMPGSEYIVESSQSPTSSNPESLRKSEGYVSTLIFKATAPDGSETELKMDSRALRLLCGGYTLSHWETPERLKSGTVYSYEILEMRDRFGEEFEFVCEPSSCTGKTSMAAPEVRIRVPMDTNVTNSTQIDVTWQNTDSAALIEYDKSEMGGMIAGLYLYKTDDPAKTPLELTAYRAGAEAADSVKQKYLEINLGEDGGKTSGARTSWVITGLAPFTSYTAVVKCSGYDIWNGKVYRDEDLSEDCTFTTVSLRSRASYTAQVDEIGADTARLSFRMNTVDDILIPLIDSVTFALEDETREEPLGSFTLKKEDLEKIAIGSLSGDSYSVPVPVRVQKEGAAAETTETATLTLRWNEYPTAKWGSAIENVWDFLLATSKTAASDGCWLSLRLGAPASEEEESLFNGDLEPITQYEGRFTTTAALGGASVDVTSPTSRNVRFQTLTEEAVVNFSNIFVADDFVELYGLEIIDVSSSILKDVENRGGNVALRIYEFDTGADVLNPVGNLIQTVYINAEDYFRPTEGEETEQRAPLRVSGLEDGEDYVMIFQAQRYLDGTSTVPKQNRALKYLRPQNVAGSGSRTDPTWYRFRTGSSVTGNVELTGVSQQYYGDNNTLTTSLSLLSEDDVYTGVWQDGAWLYHKSYADKSVAELERYRDELSPDREPDLYSVSEEDHPDLDKTALKGMPLGDYLLQEIKADLVINYKWKNGDPVLESDGSQSIEHYKRPKVGVEKDSNGVSKTLYNNFLTCAEPSEDFWTSRYFRVQAGEKFSIYNTENSSGRVSFFYVRKDGRLANYNGYWVDAYFRGGVFEVPECTQTNNLDDPIYFMRIAGRSRQMRRGMIVEKFDENKVEGRKNLAAGVEVAQGLLINTSNNVSANETIAYTSGYIPDIVGGSVYQLENRDKNMPDDLVKENSNTTTDSVLFYDNNYIFLGGYTVSAQTALVKAPFGAAYCRFNLKMQKDEHTGKFNLPDNFSMKLYKLAATHEYAASLRMNLLDQSETKIMKNGKYFVEIDVTDSAVSESDNMSKLPESSWKLWDTVVTESVGEEGLERRISELVEVNGLAANHGFRARLIVQPGGWTNRVTLDTVYFTTNRVLGTISSLSDLRAIRNDPAGSYIVTNDIDTTGLSSWILSSDRPFTGTIDFQGHTLKLHSFYALFYRISETGVVKNAVIEHTSDYYSATSVYGDVCSLARNNYGTIQNVVLKINLHNASPTMLSEDYGQDVYAGGGFCRYNYGTIDGFIVEFQQDLRVAYSYGGVCESNRGLICNGYVTGVEQPDGSRATIVHKYKNRDGVAIGTNGSYISLGIAHNLAQGTVRNMYVVNDLIIESADALKNSDKVPGTEEDTSVSDTRFSAVAVGRNSGVMEDVFVYGDRWDVDGKQTDPVLMSGRGPAVGYVDVTYHAKHVYYFTPNISSYTIGSTDGTIGTYNTPGSNESLYEYQWHEARLGADGDRFRIRSQIESGYYPHLILPACFSENGYTQPQIPLAGRSAEPVEVLFNQVRVQGKDKDGTQKALVTVSISNPRQAQVADIKIYEKDNMNPQLPMTCEVLEQGQVGDTWQVDILLSQTRQEKAGEVDKDGNPIYEMNLALDRYEIKRIMFAGDPNGNGVTDKNGERYIYADFWKEIGSVPEWTKILGSGTSGYNLRENYRLTADLDFSACTSYRDWYCGTDFKGTLDGGIYASDASSRIELTDYKGEPLYVKDDQGANTTEPLALQTNGRLVGMHVISGVGNIGRSGGYESGRDGGEFTSSLFRRLYGTLKNLIFTDFHSQELAASGSFNNVNTRRGGVVCDALKGSRLENCHVRNSNFFGCEWAGGLVGYAESASLTNCSAGQVQIRTVRLINGTQAVGVGGLLGGGHYNTIRNCFAYGSYITAVDVYDANGLGGLCGYLNASTMENCYATGTVDLMTGGKAEGIVDAGAGRVGGLLGQLTGESVLSGCWSTTTVMTAGDFAGGVVGYHAGGQLVNNYTASTLVTRSLAATSVHRICNNINFHETDRKNNYAFSGQYLTYTLTREEADKLGPNASLYQFGIWDNVDGATRLLSEEELRSAGVWINQIGLDAGAYDMTGKAKSIVDLGTLSGLSSAGGRPISGENGRVTLVAEGNMPKLVDEETGLLLYDQPNVASGLSTKSLLSRFQVTQSGDSFEVDLVIYSRREDLTGDKFRQVKDKNQVADWSKVTVTGGVLDKPYKGEADGILMTGDYEDDPELKKIYGGEGRHFQFKIKFGDNATVDGKSGHYLDSYILTVPIYTENPIKDGVLNPGTPTETLQVRLSLSGDMPVYKEIGSLEAWNEFFKPESGHAEYFENVMLTNNITFLKSGDEGFDKQYLSVKLNRLYGNMDGLGGRVFITVTPNGSEAGTLDFTSSTKSLIAQVATEISNIDFKDMKLLSAEYNSNDVATKWSGGDNKGVIGLVQGGIRNVSFTNIEVSGGNGSNIGMVGRLYGEASDIVLKDIKVRGRNHRIGGFVGFADSYSTIKRVTMTTSAGKENNLVRSDLGENTGGVVGRLDGLASDIWVNNTDVRGRYCVGGAIGYAYSNGNRQEQNKLENIVVGVTSQTPGKITEEDEEAAKAASNEPGVLVKDDGSGGVELAPNMTVQLLPSEKNGSAAQYIGGVAGHANGQRGKNLRVYNVRVKADYKEGYMTADAALPTYLFYAGGAIGYDGSQTRDSLVKNCTVSTTGSSAGGFSGHYAFWYDEVQDCVVYGESQGSEYIGGVVGRGDARRCLARHCVVSGGQYVGGVVGRGSTSSYGSDCLQSGTLDCVVLGGDYVGGVVGYNTTHDIKQVYVASSPGVTTEVKEYMLSPAEGFNGKTDTYEGTHIEGVRMSRGTADSTGGTYPHAGENVGGIFGSTYGVYLHESCVTPGVTIKGEDRVGGLVGEFYGWYKATWPTNERNLYRNMMGGSVEGRGKNVGGAIGVYTKDTTDADPGTNSYKGPHKDYMYGLLITGTVTTTDPAKAGILLGGLDEQRGGTALSWDLGTDEHIINGASFQYCRVLDTSLAASDVRESAGALGKTFAEVKAMTAIDDPGNGSKDYRAYWYPRLLTVTASDLLDPNFYFLTRNATYGGMGWDRSYWDDGTLQQMYEPMAVPASFQAYQQGIAQDGLMLWLDARNNTGKGYTDESAAVWKDLSDSGNDATLYWNNKAEGGGNSQTIGERETNMRWHNGALEFQSGSTAYYAKLKDSLSDILNDKGTAGEMGDPGFTVELIYTQTTPAYSDHKSVLSWRDGAVGGGFHGYYSPTGNYGYTLLHYNAGENVYVTGSTADKQVRYNRQAERSGVFVFDGDQKLSYYMDGEKFGENTWKNLKGRFIDTSTLEWRIGQGVYTNAYTKVCGVRVYNRALTESEIAANSAYNRWYYYGETAPAEMTVTDKGGSVYVIPAPTAPAATLTLNRDEDTGAIADDYSKGAVLCRSEDGSYHGTLVRTSSAGNIYNGEALNSRGYYYLVSGTPENPQYSPVVEVLNPWYGPRMRAYDLGNEYYHVAAYEFLFGQEGEREVSMGSENRLSLYNAQDELFYGGYRMPDAGLQDRKTGVAAPIMSTLALRPMEVIPEPTAYSSGIDTVNLELDGDAPEGMTYQIFASAEPGEADEPVLSGAWPADCRALTMTWDYKTPFTLRLTLGEETKDASWNYSALGRTVMLYGNGFWYLFGSECYRGTWPGGEQTTVGTPDDVFVHMMEGRLLDETGQIWDAETGAVSGAVRTPFRLLAAKPVWSGQLNGMAVTCYGTYEVTETEDGPLTKEASVVVRKGTAYLLQGATPYGYLLDSTHQTFLDKKGRLKDFGVALEYPEDFRNSGVRELADNLNYSSTADNDAGAKPIALVRYDDGTLVAFDYTTGEKIEVHTPKPSFGEYLMNTLRVDGLRSLLVGGESGGEGLRGLAYESEVKANASLRTALANLSGNEETSTPINGEGSGAYGQDIPGGQNGEVTSPGKNGDNGLDGVKHEGQTVVEGEGVLNEDGPVVDGAYTGQDGTAVMDGAARPTEDGEVNPEAPAEGKDPESGTEPEDPNASAEGEDPEDGTDPADPNAPAEGENPEDGTEPADPNAPAEGEDPEDGAEPADPDAPAEGEDPEDGAEPADPETPTEPGEPEDGTDPTNPETPAGVADPTTQEEPESIEVANRYVTVYDENRGGSAVYDLEEYLSTPDEELVSQEERAEQLEELGFHTTLTRKEQLPQEQASGLMLMCLVAGGTVVLLVCMSLLKKRKLDRRDED